MIVHSLFKGLMSIETAFSTNLCFKTLSNVFIANDVIAMSVW